MSFPYLVRLVPFYFRCAVVIEENDIYQANKLIAELRQHSSAIGNAAQRTAHYFMEALVSLLSGPHHFVTQVAAVEHSMQLTMNLETRYIHVKWMYGLKIIEIFVIVILGKNYVSHESLIGSFGFSTVGCFMIAVLILNYFLGITAWRSIIDLKAEGQIAQVEKVVEFCDKWMPGC